MGTPDPSSAISSVYSDVGGGASMEREGSMNSLLVDLEQLSLERGRPLDVDDLDDEGWRAASEQGKIQELGSLGEGAGGAVTRCILEGGKTVFALKVLLWALLGIFTAYLPLISNGKPNRSSLPIRIPM
jgi:mitogen-activated protein kinase kinase